MTDVVECHPGSVYAERPVALHWQGQRLEIEEIESNWRDPRGRAFRVRTRQGRRFELHYDELKDQWQVKTVGPTPTGWD